MYFGIKAIRVELTPDYSQPRGLGIFGVDEIFPGFSQGFIFYYTEFTKVTQNFSNCIIFHQKGCFMVSFNFLLRIYNYNQWNGKINFSLEFLIEFFELSQIGLKWP